MFDELKELKYYKEITEFKTFNVKYHQEISLKKQGYLEPKRVSTMELLCECT